VSAVLNLIKKLRIIDSSAAFSIGSICSDFDLKDSTIEGFKLESLKDIFSNAIFSSFVQIVTEICFKLSWNKSGFMASEIDFK